MSAKTINALNLGSITASDEIPFWDVSAGQTKKVKTSSIVGLIAADTSVLGVVYADRYGLVTDHGDVAEPASIANICSEADGDPVCIVCSGVKSYPFISSYTVPSNATVVVLPGAQFILADDVTINGRLIVTDQAIASFDAESGVTLTINGEASLGRGQVFTGTGSFTFGNGAVEAVLPDWWGLSGANDTAAVQAAIDAAPEYSGVVRLPAQDMKFNVTIDKVIRLEGPRDFVGDFYCSPYTVSSPVITIGNASSNKQGITISTLNLDADSTGQKGILVENGAYYPRLDMVSLSGFTSYGIRLYHDTGGSTVIGKPRLRDVFISCAANGDGLQSENVTFQLSDARIIADTTGSGHALSLDGSECHADNVEIDCIHGRGVLLDESSIWSLWVEITTEATTLFTLQYLGLGTPATVSIEDNDDDGAPDQLTTSCTGAGGDNLSIDLNSYSTILDLVTHINTTYPGTYLATEVLGSEAAIDLSIASGIDILSSAGSLTGKTGIESLSSDEFANFVKGPSKTTCNAKNLSGVTKDFGDYDLRSSSAIVKSGQFEDLSVTGDFVLTDSAGGPSTISVYELTGHWYLEVDFNGTAKKVELT